MERDSVMERCLGVQVSESLMQPDSEQRAFVVLLKWWRVEPLFLVMTFGLANVPSLFQRLMQKALAGLNPEGGPDFISAYIDDIRRLFMALKMVFERLQQCGLKLKPAKYHTKLSICMGHIRVEYESCIGGCSEVTKKFVDFWG